MLLNNNIIYRASRHLVPCQLIFIKNEPSKDIGLIFFTQHFLVKTVIEVINHFHPVGIIDLVICFFT